MRVLWTKNKDTLSDAQARVKVAVGGVFRGNANVVLSDMQRRTPVDTGELRGSETATSDDTSLTVKAAAEHGPYVHYGTRYMTARPFMQDALDAAVPRVQSDLIAAITRELG